jgi:hypothetical protein
VTGAHGTYAGYQRHKREGTTPCTDCLRANAEYRKQYRASHPAARDKQMIAEKRRAMALQELARRHDREFMRILQQIDYVVVRRQRRSDAA